MTKDSEYAESLKSLAVSGKPLAYESPDWVHDGNRSGPLNRIYQSVTYNRDQENG